MEFIYKAGKDFVKATMDDAEAMKIIDSGSEESDEFEGFPVKVGDMWFPAQEKPKKAVKAEPKVERVPFEGVSDEIDV